MVVLSGLMFGITNSGVVVILKILNMDYYDILLLKITRLNNNKVNK